MPDPQRPRSPDEIRRLIDDSRTRVAVAPQDCVEALGPHVDRVLAAVREVVGFEGTAWVTDESCLSDFFDFYRDRSQDQLLYDQVGARIGIPLDRTNDDDHYFVSIALRLRRRETPDGPRLS